MYEWSGQSPASAFDADHPQSIRDSGTTASRAPR
jgi:hypothetical protein